MNCWLAALFDPKVVYSRKPTDSLLWQRSCNRIGLKSDLYFAIFEAFRKEAIEIPFPQRDLHIRSISEQLSSALVHRAGSSPA